MKDKQLIYQALRMWINHIQTGSVSMSAQDAVNVGKTNEIRMLASDQQEFVIRLEELANDQLKS